MPHLHSSLEKNSCYFHKYYLIYLHKNPEKLKMGTVEWEAGVTVWYGRVHHVKQELSLFSLALRSRKEAKCNVRESIRMQQKELPEVTCLRRPPNMSTSPCDLHTKCWWSMQFNKSLLNLGCARPKGRPELKMKKTTFLDTAISAREWQLPRSI